MLIAAFPQAKVIVVTNHEGFSLRQAALRAGARKYVLKDNRIAVRSLLMRDRSVRRCGCVKRDNSRCAFVLHGFAKEAFRRARH